MCPIHSPGHPWDVKLVVMMAGCSANSQAEALVLQGQLWQLLRLYWCSVTGSGGPALSAGLAPWGGWAFSHGALFLAVSYLNPFPWSYWGAYKVPSICYLFHKF